VGGRVDDRVEPVTVGLVAVEAEVLERRDDALALDAVHRRRGQGAGEHGVLAVVLEVATVAGVAGQVHAPGEQDVEPPAAGLAPDGGAAPAGQVGVEPGGHRDGRRHGGGPVVGAVPRVGDAHAGVAAEQGGDPEAGHARGVAGGERHVVGPARVAAPAAGAGDADDQREPLVVGHLLLDLARPLVRRRVAGGHRGS
jgi:hypothetical protein